VIEKTKYLLLAFDIDKPIGECHFMYKYIDAKTFTGLKDTSETEVFLEEKKYSITNKRTAVVPYMNTNTNWLLIIDVKKISA